MALETPAWDATRDIIRRPTQSHACHSQPSAWTSTCMHSRPANPQDAKIVPFRSDMSSSKGKGPGSHNQFNPASNRASAGIPLLIERMGAAPLSC